MTNGFTRWSSPWLRSGFRMVELPLQYTVDFENRYYDVYLNGEWLGSKRAKLLKELMNDRAKEYQAGQERAKAY